MEDEEDLEKLKDGAQVRMMLWLEIEKEKSHFANEVKLMGGDFAVYTETVRFFLWEDMSIFVVLLSHSVTNSMNIIKVKIKHF